MFPVFINLIKSELLPSQVYHYTNGVAFLGIIQNKEFWASHILFQNDRMEGKHSLYLLNEILNKKKQDLSAKGINCDTVINFVSDFTGLGTFTVSFSEKRDDLNQWRGYANTNPAYCIGFYSSVLKDLQPEAADKTKPIEMFFAKCIYKRDGQVSLIRDLVDHVLSKIEIPKNKAGNVSIKFAGELMSDFLPMSSVFKNPAFEEEKEWRLVFSPVPNDLINIRMGKSQFIPYIKVKFPDRAIGDIIIAPNPDKEQIYNSTTYACSHSKIDMKLENSSVPYRNW